MKNMDLIKYYPRTGHLLQDTLVEKISSTIFSWNIATYTYNKYDSVEVEVKISDLITRKINGKPHGEIKSNNSLAVFQPW